MNGFLTTHVLDTARGCPAEGLRIDLFRIDGETRTHLKTLATNNDGRTDEQILPASEFQTGVYELVFHAGDYLDVSAAPPEDPRFLVHRASRSLTVGRVSEAEADLAGALKRRPGFGDALALQSMIAVVQNERDLALELALKAATLCNNSHLVKEDGAWGIVGDPTEAALITAGRKAGLSQLGLKTQYPRRRDCLLYTSDAADDSIRV